MSHMFDIQILVLMLEQARTGQLMLLVQEEVQLLPPCYGEERLCFLVPERGLRRFQRPAHRFHHSVVTVFQNYRQFGQTTV